MQHPTSQTISENPTTYTELLSIFILYYSRRQTRNVTVTMAENSSADPGEHSVNELAST